MDQVLDYIKIAGKYLKSVVQRSVSVFYRRDFYPLGRKAGVFSFEEFVGRLLLKNQHLDMGTRGSIKRFSRYFILLLGFFIALDTVGISLSSLAAVGAVLMVGIGFGLQNITQNFISGTIILLNAL